MRPLLGLIEDQEFFKLINDQQERLSAYFRAGLCCLQEQIA